MPEEVDPNDEEERAKAAERLLGGRDLCRARRCRRSSIAGAAGFCREHWRSLPTKLRLRLLHFPDDAALLAGAVAELRRIKLERADR